MHTHVKILKKKFFFSKHFQISHLILACNTERLKVVNTAVLADVDAVQAFSGELKSLNLIMT